MPSFLKLTLGNLLIMGVFMLFSSVCLSECVIDAKTFDYLEKLRPESCADWPYEDSQLSRSSCQDCVERLADVCRFIQDTSMTRDQKDKLDQRCKDLQNE